MWVVCGLFFKKREKHLYKYKTNIPHMVQGEGGEFVYLKRRVMNADTRSIGYRKKTRAKMKTSDFFGIQDHDNHHSQRD